MTENVPVPRTPVDRVQRKKDFVERNPANSRVMLVDNPETHAILDVARQFDRVMSTWRRKIGKDIPFSEAEKMFKDVQAFLEEQKTAVQAFCDAVDIRYLEYARKSDNKSQTEKTKDKE